MREPDWETAKWYFGTEWFTSIHKELCGDPFNGITSCAKFFYRNFNERRLSDDELRMMIKTWRRSKVEGIGTEKSEV